MNENEKRVQLTGDAKQTATWVQVLETGDVLIDHYDYSEHAHSFFGNDVASVLVIDAADKTTFLERLAIGRKEQQGVFGEGLNIVTDPDELLLMLIQEQFDNYPQVEAWLNDNQVAYQKTFDSWA